MVPPPQPRLPCRRLRGPWSILVAGLLAIQACAQSGPPALSRPFDDDLVGPIKFTDMPLDSLLAELTLLTDRSILRPPQLPALSYSLAIDRRLPRSEAVQAIETLLVLSQIGVAPLGDKFLKVVALSQLKNEAPEMITGSTLALTPSGHIATKVFQFNFLRASELMPQIGPDPLPRHPERGRPPRPRQRGAHHRLGQQPPAGRDAPPAAGPAVAGRPRAPVLPAPLRQGP